RISAITVAERVADERGERLGRSVGYQIRLEAKLPRPQGSILFCTTGIILQWLQSDPLLSGISHLILDEIHERDSQSDFLISIAKDLLPLRPDLKVVLMSATLNAETFSTYYGNCPTIHIPGFTYNVKQHYLEDVLNITKFKYPLKTKGSFVPWKRYKEGADDKEFEDFILPHIRKLESEKAYPEVSAIEQLRESGGEELESGLVLALLIAHRHAAEGPFWFFVARLGGPNSKLHKMIPVGSLLLDPQLTFW
ncbi:UNVERIFIED_CONTAM: hypothetical protein GTU68_057753, partial [Idotea baltica]|nr:hypothetical protein [Idotea baltica]